LMDLVVESAAPEHGIRRGWFRRAQAPAGVALTFECELGYTFDPAVWGQGFATEAVRCVRDYARDVLRLSYAISAILPQNAPSRRRTVRRASRRPNGSGRSQVGSLRVAARDRRCGSAPAGIHEIGVAGTGARGGAGSPAAPARTRRAPRAPARGPTPADSEDDTKDSAPTGARAPRSGSTSSTRRAAHAVMRRPPQLGQKPGPLQEKGTSRSNAQSVHRRRAKPWQPRASATLLPTVRGNRFLGEVWVSERG
jgi:hypothetical protein